MRIRGARVHNLQNVDVDLPRDRLTVITGLSGSGKSSLAFDTLFAEGQRQYIESLSVYARQFFDQLERPDVDAVDGLEPTLCIDQKSGTHNRRSTVATITEIYDYLRLLFARVGIPHCHQCGCEIAQQSADTIVQEVLALPSGTKVMLLAPLVRGRRGKHEEVFQEITKAGFVRARVDSQMALLEEIPPLAPRRKHTIEAVIDRVVVREDLHDRLDQSVRLALKMGKGLIVVMTLPPGKEDWQERLLSSHFACPDCGTSYPELEPRSFSFNSPYGACVGCDGMGTIQQEGLCPQCHGGRLRPEALAVTVAGQNLQRLVDLPIAELSPWFAQLSLPDIAQRVADPICREVTKRLRFLDLVGVGYLSLSRPANTLSGGELQRVRLATSIGSGLVGVCYVLDEPSIGLHQRDNDRLIAALRDLQRQGNTVVVVEHDEAMMRAADWLIDMGPGAGQHGGRIVSQGTPDQVSADPHSVTGPYLQGTESTVPQRVVRKVNPRKSLSIRGARMHNLRNVSVDFPLGCLIGVTGVSGSGKSSLINETLYPAVAASLGLASGRSGTAKLKGAEAIDRLIWIDQGPIGRSPRSCPATFAGALDEIRKVFAATRDAKQRGFGPGRFSFNSTAGQCAKCKGYGQEKIEMNFLSDLYVSCGQCTGRRYNQATLAVRFKGHTIGDVLQLTIEQARAFFENIPKIDRILRSLCDVGLGYLQLGQPSTTLSGGEAQRLKLGTELARGGTGATLYLLDEPTTGLHFADVKCLVSVLDQLVAANNTVIVIEHNMDVVRACDWVIDLGPGGGSAGGQVVASGPPEKIRQTAASETGKYLGAPRTP